MAERRMFSSKIVCSDAFTEMPFSAQALYLQLNMEADDDGFLNNARRVMRTIAATDSDLNLLFEKRYILGFQNGVIVIKHWRMNNQIRKDRYTPTQYQDEFHSLDIKKDGAYTEKRGANSGTVLAPTWQPNDTDLATQVRLGKVSIGKVSIDKGEEKIIVDDPPAPIKTDYQQVIDLYHSICVSFPKIRSISEARKKAIKARLNTYTLEDFKALFEKAEASQFLKGRNERNWTATFDWLIKDANMAKVLEGNYDDKPGRYTRSERKPNWMQPSMTLGQAEMDNIKRLMTEEDPAVQAEAEEMRKRMQEKYGKAVQ